MAALRSETMLRWVTGVLIFVFFGSALLYCNSMLSATTVLPDTNSKICDGIKPVDQVVVLLIDALRPDFALSALRAYTREEGGCTIPKTRSVIEDTYGGATLNYIEKSLQNSNDPSHSYFLVADAPTTTAQRIKAIATGAMPAFLEAGSNFNSDATPLDNLIRQMEGRSAVLGDDTWLKLFPHVVQNGTDLHWKKAITLPSFDVADFHSNDDTVLSIIYDLLNKETKENDEKHARLIIGHFLGVDHVGHRINADNTDMSMKLAQLNQMLFNVSKTLKDRQTSMKTMLLVFGDHGMTGSGDHGGDSALETDTFLFAKLYGRKEENTSNDWSNKRDLLCGANKHRWESKVDRELERLDSCRGKANVDACKLGAAYQVDVTPTISILLGRPIPFSSLGRVLPEVILLADATADLEKVQQCNLEQLKTYFQKAEVSEPSHATWKMNSVSVEEKIAQMSLFVRRSGADMNYVGMFFGCFLLLCLAESIFFIPTVRQCFTHRSFFTIMTCIILVLRLCTTFSNSFVVNEDTEVLTLLSVLIIALLVALNADCLSPSRSSSLLSPIQICTQNIGFNKRTASKILFSFLFFSRCAQSGVLRYREHITHNVASSSALDDYIHPRVSPSSSMERIGIVTAILMSLSLHSDMANTRCFSIRDVLFFACGLTMCAVYKTPVVHHLVPISFAILIYVLQQNNSVKRHKSSLSNSKREKKSEECGLAANSGSTSEKTVNHPFLYPYLVWVMWCSSLCNEKYVAGIIIAIYGNYLPLFIRAIQPLPSFTQALCIHLIMYAAFFLEGHQCMLNTIDWNSSFVGMPFYNIFGGAILVLSRTFNAFLFAPIAVKVALPPLLDEHPTKSGTLLKRRRTHLFNEVRILLHLLIHLGVVQSAVSCFNAYIQKNHLMLYPIFCPKLIFDVVITLMTGAGYLLSLLVL